MRWCCGVPICQNDYFCAIMAKQTSKPTASVNNSNSSNGQTSTLKTYLNNLCKITPKRIFRAGLALIAMLLTYIAVSSPSSGVTMGLLVAFMDGMNMSGKAAGNVYQRNGIRRQFVIPALVQNSFTQAVRATFTAFSQAFRSLTQDQQDGWNNSTAFTTTNRLGRVSILKGKPLYQRLNQNLAAIGHVGIDDCPLPVAVPAITAITPVMDFSSDTMTLTFAPTPTDADVTHILFATAPQGTGINKPRKSSFRQIGIIAGATATGYNFKADYQAKFGVAPVGSKVFVKTIAVSSITGQAGGVAIGGGTVAA